MKLTGWYQGNQKPKRKGTYEVKYTGYKRYSYWCGVCFHYPFTDLFWANELKADVQRAANQNLPWRGVAK